MGGSHAQVCRVSSVSTALAGGARQFITRSLYFVRVGRWLSEHLRILLTAGPYCSRYLVLQTVGPCKEGPTHMDVLSGATTRCRFSLLHLSLSLSTSRPDSPPLLLLPPPPPPSPPPPPPSTASLSPLPISLRVPPTLILPRFLSHLLTHKILNAPLADLPAPRPTFVLSYPPPFSSRSVRTLRPRPRYCLSPVTAFFFSVKKKCFRETRPTHSLNSDFSLGSAPTSPPLVPQTSELGDPGERALCSFVSLPLGAHFALFAADQILPAPLPATRICRPLPSRLRAEASCLI